MYGTATAHEAIREALAREETEPVVLTDAEVTLLPNAIAVLSLDETIETIALLSDVGVEVPDPPADRSDEVKFAAEVRAILFELAKAHPLAFGVAGLAAIIEVYKYDEAVAEVSDLLVEVFTALAEDFETV